jgi:hypothetical protein
MDTTTLVEKLIDEGRRVVDALVGGRLPVNAALWLYFPEPEEWRLAVATPWYDLKGSRRTYARIRTILGTLTPPTPIPLLNFTALSPAADLIEGLRTANTIGTGIVERRLRGVFYGNVFIDDAYVYRIADRTYLPVERPRRAVPLPNGGDGAEGRWNTYLLAGLLGQPVQQVEETGVPHPLTVKSLEDWLNRAQQRGFLRRWDRETIPELWPGRPGNRHTAHTWAYRRALWLRRGYYPLLLPQDGRLVMLCGLREDRREHHSPHDQLLVSSPASPEEWLGASAFFSRYRPVRSGQVFVKPDGQGREPG